MGAAGSILLLPMHLYSAGFLGNENLTAVLCAAGLGLLVVVMRTGSALHAPRNAALTRLFSRARPVRVSYRIEWPARLLIAS